MKRFADGFEGALSRKVEEILKDPRLQVPGVVVYARRGADVVHKAFGVADVDSGAPMTTDAVFRMYSMTKVLTAAVALMLQERGLLTLEDPVAKYIPSFAREWRVVEPGESSDESVEYCNHILGTKQELHYRSPRC